MGRTKWDEDDHESSKSSAILRNYATHTCSRPNGTKWIKIRETIWNWSRTKTHNPASQHEDAQTLSLFACRTQTGQWNQRLRRASSCANSTGPSWIWKPQVIWNYVGSQPWRLQFLLVRVNEPGCIVLIMTIQGPTKGGSGQNWLETIMRWDKFSAAKVQLVEKMLKEWNASSVRLLIVSCETQIGHFIFIWFMLWS